ncbi:DUF6064 family protein [Salegentibacter chungangensis]|uniref:DUF6064 family protein n=1 Tax=Salegentibacter chungangensis TaxID=1335724 RepID=A0ABW3NQW5_9FLAO
METPFTIDDFFKVFGDYNSSVFPVQFTFILFGIIAVILLHKKKQISSYFITGLLGALWLWMGIVYHIYFFSSINKAAYAFGGLFIIQGLLFIIYAFQKKLNFSIENTSSGIIGYIFILFGLIIYPLIGYSLGGSIEKTISLGLPCPTTIFTFGLFMLTTNKFPKHLLIIPTIWAIIGTSAAINFEVYQDYFMLIAAVTANIYLIQRKSRHH